MDDLYFLVSIVFCCLGIIVLILTIKRYRSPSLSAPQQQPPQMVLVRSRQKPKWGYVFAILLIGISIFSGFIGITNENQKLHQEALQQGEKACKKAIARNFNDCVERFVKGYTLHELGRYEEAIDAYDQLLLLEPNNNVAWYNKGIAFRKLGRYKEAIFAYDQSIALDPKYTPPWNNKGYALDDLGKYEEAIAAYDQVIVLDPKNSIAWNNKGISLEHLGRYKEALNAYEKALELDSSNQMAWTNRANLQQKMRNN